MGQPWPATVTVVAGNVGFLAAAQSTGSSRAFMLSTNRGNAVSRRTVGGGRTGLRGCV